MTEIRLARSDEDIQRCFPVMRQLRTHLVESEFVGLVRRQEGGGYRLVLAYDDDAVTAVAGYRILENLFASRMLYVDDLVTDADARSSGIGRQLLNWLVERAREEGCRTLELDSGVQRFDAHRFYLTNRMIISSHHFRLEL